MWVDQRVQHVNGSLFCEHRQRCGIHASTSFTEGVLICGLTRAQWTQDAASPYPKRVTHAIAGTQWMLNFAAAILRFVAYPAVKENELLCRCQFRGQVLLCSYM